MSTVPHRARSVAIAGALALGIAATAVPGPAAADIACTAKTHGGGAFYQGPAASNAYDTRFSAGPGLPWLQDYVPQGVASWYNWDGARNLLVVASYAAAGGKARLSGIDPSNGKRLGTVAIAATHAGGIAITKGWAFVQGQDDGNKHYIRKYRLSDLRAKFKQAGVPDLKQTGKARQVYGSAFLSSYGDNLYAGSFNDSGRGLMYRYKVAANGSLATQKGAYEVPTKTQGLLVTKDHFVYSTSYGNDNRSNIYVVDGGARDIDRPSTRCFRAPSMAEGITDYLGTAYLVYESGAQVYVNQSPRNIIPNFHKAAVSSITSFR
jgi:hypothetical protein